MKEKVTQKPTLVLATHNSGKVREIQAYLGPYVEKLLTAADFGLPEPAETGKTFAENATLKALFVAQKTGMMALADDSGLCVEALGGLPGVYSADWAGLPRDYTKAMNRLQKELEKQPNRRAYFACCLALVWPDGRVETVEEHDAGILVWPPRGTSGFGYDPMFVREGGSRTNAELSLEEKNKNSHRARALEKLVKLYFQ